MTTELNGSTILERAKPIVERVMEAGTGLRNIGDHITYEPHPLRSKIAFGIKFIGIPTLAAVWFIGRMRSGR